ncbi:MAG TPA: hemolysin family protein [Bacillota bacterium]|nr:hemolysin family protein [Bacillota bacterium]
MKAVLFEIGAILVLLLLNGLFAMVEIALVSAKKGRLRVLADRGDTRAQVALELAESPNRFLATVQIGITLVGILAGAFGGATIATHLSRFLGSAPLLAPYSETIALGLVVLAITYLSLIIGELLPKRLGLGNPEGISMLTARFMQRLSNLVSPIVRLLNTSTDLVLRLCGITGKAPTTVSEEEVKGLMQEGLRAGAFHKVESDIVASVLGLDLLPVRDIMTPRPKVIWLNRDDSHEVIWHKIVVSNHSHFPVYQGHRDNVVGVVSVKAIYAHLAAGLPVTLGDLMVKPLFVPAVQNVLQLVETFKQSRQHLALAVDEFGVVVGLVTLTDIMEAIVGDFPSPDERAKPAAMRRADGTWLIDALIEIEQVESVLPGFKTQDPDSKNYQTLAGFIIKHLGHVPKEGETLESQGYIFEVLDMDAHRIDKVLVMPRQLQPGKPHS